MLREHFALASHLLTTNLKPSRKHFELGLRPRPPKTYFIHPLRLNGARICINGRKERQRVGSVWMWHNMMWQELTRPCAKAESALPHRADKSQAGQPQGDVTSRRAITTVAGLDATPQTKRLEKGVVCDSTCVLPGCATQCIQGDKILAKLSSKRQGD